MIYTICVITRMGWLVCLRIMLGDEKGKPLKYSSSSIEFGLAMTGILGLILMLVSTFGLAFRTRVLGLLGSVRRHTTSRLLNFVTKKRIFLPNKFLLGPSSIVRSMSSALSMSSTSTSTLPSKPVEYFRKDYQKPNYLIPEISLTFKLHPSDTKVITSSKIHRNIDSITDLVLDGEDIKLLTVKINGVVIPSTSYQVTRTQLIINQQVIPAGDFILETEVQLNPQENLALSGLYASGNMLCTQCEAMGFRRITYHLDRPDVLSKYLVRLEGSRTTYPLLLSNGNLIDSGVINEDTHWTLWEDPFLKPSYLFALVAGDLGYIKDTYTTKSGKQVSLGIYSDKENVGKLSHAMYSLKRSMQWDEDTFNLECDLDLYNIVATKDFNMGAMENKGLNIFNSAYVLADPSTATDTDYENILGVIAHEYFHNWTGNRVTVRDWFQLTLKEGLTVFRDQWFSSDVTSHAVKRIEDVRGLRSRQFAEDSGPMSHPIRPETYISMDNFYTGTVYVKGAEVVRMYRTILGEAGFKKGMALYFQRHDGGAVTCDDFRAAMADATGVNLDQFERWYSQAGTPVVDVSESYDVSTQTYKITLEQHTPSTPGQPQESKLPLMIPVVVGLLSPSGVELAPSKVLLLTESKMTFEFKGIPEKPIPSVLRDFSAPVKIRLEQSSADLSVLMAYDTDSYNRWEAANRLSTEVVLTLASLPVEKIKTQKLSESYVTAMRKVLESRKTSTSGLDLSLIAYAIQLPDMLTLSQEMEIIDPDRLHLARKHVQESLAIELFSELQSAYLDTQGPAAYVFSPEEVSRRRLRNTCLAYLTSVESKAAIELAYTQFVNANCMSDKISALSSLASTSGPEREKVLQQFFTDAAGDALVINKWFGIQAMADRKGLLNDVKQLKSHPDFTMTNPNRARSLISVFAGNMPYFHAQDGKGYEFIADCVIEIDKCNPQVAARMAGSFSQWRRFDTARQTLMQQELNRILSTQGLSKDTYEVCSRTLN